ncbi:Gamma-butyrobetaine dioxygenase [Phytophthora ramorum]|uniref:Gamma-butyrobetaine dioxygenase n=1 Tax=Phytophthora ramorum TaxID=164328 RepID=UPI0030971025|nr:Gamma-butyrobetaine dioxygenase [Phytophthora ramorum]
MAVIVQVEVTPDQVQLTWGNGKTSSLLHVWLRDNCRCSACYHAVALERILDSSSIALDIQPKSVDVNQTHDILEVVWSTEDAHESIYTIGFLEKYSGFANEANDVGQKLWNVADMASELPRVRYDSIMADEKGVLAWLEKLHTFGFTIVGGVPYGHKRVEDVGRRISIIRNTFWGESSWDVKDIPDPTSLSLTGGALFPHTDLCFSDSQPGVQFLHCLELTAAKIEGGESTLVDGYFVADKIRRESPEAFKVLTTERVAHVFSSNKHHFRFDGPVIRLDPTDGSVKELRYNQALLAPLENASKELYAALQLFAHETRSLANLLHFRLHEGEMLVFDNRRMMHGRTAYNAVDTRRHLEGCYLDYEEFQGRLKKLRESTSLAIPSLAGPPRQALDKPQFERMTVELTAIAIVFALMVSVEAAPDPMDYPACPQRHHPDFYCCTTSSSTREVFTRFTRPVGGSYEADYAVGWAQPRQVNFPYARYTPDTPTFTYEDPEAVCRLQTVVVDALTGEIQQKLQCGSENASMVEDSRDATVFWTSPSNPRNNNASFPVGAQCVSLMLDDGSVDEDSKAACVSESLLGDFQFTSFMEPSLVLVYLVYLACFALLAWWNFHSSAIHHKNCSLTEGDKALAAGGVTEFKGMMSRTKYALLREPNAEPKKLLQTGYSSSTLGRLVFVYFVLVSVLLHVLLLVVICDYYGSFTPPLFDPLSANATVFFLVWLFAALWSIGIVAYQRDLPNFFREPSPLHKCEFVHMFKSNDTEIMLTDRTGISALVAKVENWFSSSGKLRGYQETVRVELVDGQRMVDFQHLRYVYDEDPKQFVPAEISVGRTYADIGAAGGSGLTSTEAKNRLRMIGMNVVDVNMPSLLSSVLLEFLTMFYIYQIMCYYVWYYFTYWNMGIVMTLVVVGTAVINIYTKRKMQAAIVKMTRYQTEVSVFRDNHWQVVESPELVPGDLVQVPENWVLPCDMVIVKGATVCDESMLTAHVVFGNASAVFGSQ